MTEQEMLATRDDDIIRRLEVWATGSTIHDVKNLIGFYRSVIYILDSGRDVTTKGNSGLRNHYLKCLVCAVNRSNHFMQYGDYKLTSNLFPIPQDHPDYV